MGKVYSKDEVIKMVEEAKSDILIDLDNNHIVFKEK